MRPAITLNYLRLSTKHFQENFFFLLLNWDKETKKRHKNLIKLHLSFFFFFFFSINLMKTRVFFMSVGLFIYLFSEHYFEFDFPGIRQKRCIIKEFVPMKVK